MTGEERRELRPRISLSDRRLLATREGRATLARIDAATTEFAALDRDQHVRGIALIVLRAKRSTSVPPRKSNRPAPQDLARDHTAGQAR